MGYGIQVLIKGQRACFSRPELKSERVSYDVITPSAARGVLEAVYWKPAIRWVIDRIEVLNAIKFDTFRRNELGGKLSYRNAKAAMLSDSEFYTDASADRQQRATLYLKDVAYIVTAHFEMTSAQGENDTPEKHYNIALRRLRRGQCFNQPYLGCREFAAQVILVDENMLADEKLKSVYADVAEHDFGFMLDDIDFDLGMTPHFFHAVMKKGLIDVEAARKEVLG